LHQIDLGMLGKAAQCHSQGGLTAEWPELLRFCATGAQSSPGRNNKGSNISHTAHSLQSKPRFSALFDNPHP
jgi:hypothetical protein